MKPHGGSRPGRQNRQSWTDGKLTEYRGIRARGPKVARPDDLLVVCWCQKHSDFVPKQDVMAGTTWSCGPRCYDRRNT